MVKGRSNSSPDPRVNHLLASLPEPDYQRLAVQLERVPMPLGMAVYESGGAQGFVYFPADSIVSLLYVLEDGASTEIAVTGNEGLVGISLFMGGESTPSRAVVQSAGQGYRVRGASLKKLFASSGSVQHNVIIEEQVDDDRNTVTKGDRVLLIVEDDVAYARILLDIAHSKGFKGIIATRGESALHLAQRYRPDAVTLDIVLPDMEGWTVLDRLKHDKSTRHIPVHIISADEESSRGLKLGAFAQVQKPVTKEGLEEAFSKIQGFLERQNKSLLVIEDNEEQRKAITELIGGEGDVEITGVSSGQEALEILRERRFDCMVLDLGLPDMNGFDFINRLKNELHVDDIPIVVYTGRELSKKEETELKRMAEAIIIKDK